MAVSVINVGVGNNPSPFLTPFYFEITFDCMSQLQDDLEWKLIYVGSADDKSLDQELETVLVGPVQVGINKFVLETPPPDPSLIPESDVIGVTVVMLTCAYKGQEFIRVGYYVNNEFAEPLAEGEAPPSPLDPSKILRNVLADKPRVTHFSIKWDGDAADDLAEHAAESSAAQPMEDDNDDAIDEDEMGEDEEESLEEDGESGDEDEAEAAEPAGPSAAAAAHSSVPAQVPAS